MRICFLVLMTVFATLVARPVAEAHPRKEANLEISYNERTDRVEIVHRFRLYDAEDVVQKLYEPTLSIVEDERAQALFGEYVEARFSLIRDGQAVDLSFVGGEIADGSVWIYQEAEPFPLEGVFVLRHSALMDVFANQVSIVNIRLTDEVESFLLSRTSPWATFRLDGEALYAD